MYSETMKVEVEFQYLAIPPDDELETIRSAGKNLTTDRKSVSVRVVETDAYPLVILEFVMKNQPQYNVVSEISDEVQRLLGELLKDITIRFPQPEKKSRTR
jgi:hypothetical protein